MHLCLWKTLSQNCPHGEIRQWQIDQSVILESSGQENALKPENLQDRESSKARARAVKNLNNIYIPWQISFKRGLDSGKSTSLLSWRVLAKKMPKNRKILTALLQMSLSWGNGAGNRPEGRLT